MKMKTNQTAELENSLTRDISEYNQKETKFCCSPNDSF